MTPFGSATTHDLGALERNRITEALRRALEAEERVRVAFLFGSFARGEPFRDVDIGVELDEPFRLLSLGGLSRRLWTALGRPRFELDVVPLNDAPHSFRLEVADGGRVLHERHPGDAFEFAVQAQSDTIDFRLAWEAAGSWEQSE